MSARVVLKVIAVVWVASSKVIVNLNRVEVFKSRKWSVDEGVFEFECVKSKWSKVEVVED